MKRVKNDFFVRQFFRVPMLIVFLAMVVIFGFSALGQAAEVDDYANVTALGVDLSDEEEEKFDLSLLMFVPVAGESFAEKYKLISATGSNMAEAIDFAGLHVGKEVGLSHIKFVVLNEDIVAENLSLLLDYFVRSIQLPTSTKIIVTDSPAKDFLQAAQALESESSIKVSDIITYNNDYLFATDSSMESFFKGTYGPTKAGMLTVLSLEEADSEGIPTVLESGAQGDGNSSGQSSGSSGGQSSGSSREILNNGDVIICKDGKMLTKIEGEELENINLLRGKYTTGSIEVRNFSDETFSNVNLIFEIFDHSNKLSVRYENSIPVVNLDVSLTVRLSEIESESEISQNNIELFVLGESATDAIEIEMKSKMASAVALMREYSVDLADFYTFLYNSGKNKFLNFLEGLGEESYLNHIVFKSSVRVYAK